MPIHLLKAMVDIFKVTRKGTSLHLEATKKRAEDCTQVAAGARGEQNVVIKLPKGRNKHCPLTTPYTINKNVSKLFSCVKTTEDN